VERVIRLHYQIQMRYIHMVAQKQQKHFFCCTVLRRIFVHLRTSAWSLKNVITTAVENA
jgi:hypothetical protein